MLHRKKKVDSLMTDVELAALKHGYPVWDKSSTEAILLYFDKEKQEFVSRDEFVGRQKKYAAERRAKYSHGYRNGCSRRNTFFSHS